jgi:hypothetical protein
VISIDPRDPNTFPKRTEVNGRPHSKPAVAVNRSVTRFDNPNTLTGSAALSVEMLMNRSTPHAAAAANTFRVPNTFVL